MADIQLGYTGAQINAKLAQVDINQTNINNLLGHQEKYFSNVQVAVNAWAANNTYQDYPYRATIPLTDITANHFAEVIFNPTDAASGRFAPVCETYQGGVTIYAIAIPLAAMTIPTIKCVLTQG